MSELNGNPKEKGVVFTAGPRNVSVDELIRATDSAVTGFVKNQHWKDSQNQEFMLAYHNLIDSINNGTIAKRDLGRNLIDTTGTYKNDEDKFDAYGYAAGFINKYADALPEYKEKEVKKELEKYHKGKSNRILKAINDTYYGGNFTASKEDMELWRDRDVVGLDGVRPTTKRVEALVKIIDKEIEDVKSKEYDYTDSPYRDKDDLLERLGRLSANLKNGTIDSSDLNDFVAVGIPANVAKLLFENDLDKYYTGKSAQSGELTELQKKQKQLAELQAARKEEEDLAAADKAIQEELALQTYDDWYNNFASGYDLTLFYRDNISDDLLWYNQNINRDNVSKAWDDIVDNYYTYQKLLSQGVNPEILEADGGVNDAIYKTLAGLKYFQPYMKDQLIELSDGTFAIPAMEDYEQGTVGVWNPNLNELSVRSIKNLPEYKELLKQRYVSGYKHQRHVVPTDPDWYTNILQQIEEMKGVKKHQSGAEIQRRWTNNNANQQTQQTKPVQSTNTEENTDEADWDAWDTAQVALDTISMASAYVPGYGTLASLLTGLVSSGIQVSQDGDIGQLMGNVASDAMGMIPGLGTAGKAAKTLSKLRKLAPLAGVITSGAVNGEQLLNMLDKGFDNFSGDDWSVLVKFALGALRGVGQHARGIESITKGTERTKVKTTTKHTSKKSNKTLNDDEVNKIKSLEGKKVTEIPEEDKAFAAEHLKIKGKGEKATVGKNQTKSTTTKEIEFDDDLDIDGFEKWVLNPRIPWMNNPRMLTAKDFIFGNPNNFKKPPTSVSSNKNGGTVKYLRSLQGGGNSWKGTVMDRSKDYLNVDNNQSNATQPTAWNGYYNMDKIKTDSMNTFKSKSGHNLSIDLNNLESFNDLNWKPQLNALGYNDWNNSFHNTGMNEYFGFDTKRFDYMGPSTYNRKQYYDWLKTQEIQTNDGTVKFDGTKWIHTTSTPSTDTGVDPAAIAAQAKKAQLKKDVDRAIAAVNTSTSGSTGGDGSRVSEKVVDDKFNPAKTTNWAGIIGNVIGVGRLAGILRDNKKASEQYAKSIIPASENYLHRNNPLFDPSSTRVGAANDAAFLINSFEATANNNDNIRDRYTRLLGAIRHKSAVNMQADDVVRQQIASNYEKQHEVDKYNLGVANRNSARDIAALAAKRQLPAQLTLVQRASIDAALKDKEKSLKQLGNKFGQYQLAENVKDAALFTKESPENIAFEALKENYRKWQLENPGKTYHDYEQYDQYKKALDELQKVYRGNVGTVYDKYWNDQLWFAKKGGSVQSAKVKAKSKDSELFHKDIHQNIKNSIKLINNLSNVTKRLILKAMDA